MAIRWEKLTVKTQQAIQEAQSRAAELTNPELQPVHAFQKEKPPASPKPTASTTP